MDKQTGHWCNSAYWKRMVPHLEDIVQDTFLGPTSGTYSLDSRWGDRRVHSVPTTGMTSFHQVEVQPEFDAEQSKNEIVKAVEECPSALPVQVFDAGRPSFRKPGTWPMVEEDLPCSEVYSRNQERYTDYVFPHFDPWVITKV